MAYLICTHGVDQGLVRELGHQNYTMGRARDCDLVLSDEKASRYHCKVYYSGSNYYVEDLGSTNGVKFKNKRFRGKRFKLKPDQIFRIGKDWFLLTHTPPDLVAQAAKEVVEGLRDQDRGRIIEKTFLDAITTSQRKKKSRFRLFSLLSFLRKKK